MTISVLHGKFGLPVLKWKQLAHDMGTRGSASNLLHEALTQGHTINLDILG